MRHPWRAIRRHPARSVSIAAVVAGAVGFVIFYFAPQALFINTAVNEAAPTSVSTAAPARSTGVPAPASTAPVVLASGPFRSLEHQTSGTAVLLRLSDGTVVLRLESLNTSNGPDVHVTLSPAAPSGGLNDYNDGYLDLGSLKGNIGNQNYALPGDTDPSRFRSAVIWCRRFTVAFGVAPLTLSNGGG